ncbi:hypothetical protein EDB86DRAFT_1233076 [Lactarius hatsudake]|nr:hypothetical protein EDB86DRAFT_1233076 [Lactarius hatsudake]
MPALIPVDNTLGALFIGTVLSSIVYGVTWLQGYSYCSSHCSQDRWPLKSFSLQVAFLMLVDTVNLVFCICTTYQFCVTNFGDYRSIASHPWSLFATAFPSLVLAVSVQHFYAYRIYCLGGSSPYLPAAISITSLTEFGLGILFSATALKHIHDPDQGNFEGLFFAGLSCKVLCDALITTGMVYYLLSNRTQVRRTNNVLNLLAIYSINCGILHLVFSIVALTSFAKYRDTLIYVPPLFIVFRLNSCGFMSILNSRRYLRETLDGPEGVVGTFTQLRVPTGTTVPWGVRDTTEASTNAAVLESLPPASVSSDTSLSDSVIAFDRERYPVPPVMQLGLGSN